MGEAFRGGLGTARPPVSHRSRADPRVPPCPRPLHRATRQKKTMKLSRALSDLVKYTKSVGIHDVEMEGEGDGGPGTGGPPLLGES